MHLETVDRFFTLFFGGAGLLAVGAVNLLLLKSRFRTRAAASVGVCCLALGAAALWQQNTASVVRSGAYIAVGLVPAMLIGTGLYRRLSDAVRRPTVRWGFLTAAGFACVVGSAAWFEAASSDEADRDTDDLTELTMRPPLKVAEKAGVATDARREVLVKLPASPRPGSEVEGPEQRFLSRTQKADKLIRTYPAADATNCHGWVFTGGHFWVGGDCVGQILAENGYVVVTAPRPGDLAVYRDAAGAVSHTAIVRYVTDGQPVIVEGKWGCMSVFMPAADQSAYGSNFAFYRSPRAGHLLAGVVPSSAAPTGTSATATSTAHPNPASLPAVP
jgi:hypothetical protein